MQSKVRYKQLSGDNTDENAVANMSAILTWHFHLSEHWTANIK